MRLKDPFSLKAVDMTKRTNKPRKPRDEESSDEVSGLTCQHVSKAVDLSSVKKSVLSSVWFVCSDCLKERTMIDGEPAASHDILVCLKCGFQGCNHSGIQHAVKHYQAFHPESHCITISLSTWKAWCFECNEELSTHCNKKALAQSLDFLQKHSVKATSAASPKIIKLREEASDYSEPARGKNPTINSTLVPVKGINNLGNTCFFNAVMQNLSQTHMLIELIQEVKEKGYKLRICPAVDANLSLLTVTLPNPEPLTAAMFLFLQTMKEPGKSHVNPKILFNQLCQKAPRFKGYQQQDSQELLHYLLDSIRVEETKRVRAGILKAFNNPTEKTADDETKRQVKAYGKEGVKMNFVDRIFVGELTNTIMCEECEHISTVKEAFIDISLPIIEERMSKPSNPGRLGKGSKEQDAHSAHADQLLSAAHSSNRNTRKLSGQKQQTRRASSSVEEKGAGCGAERPEEEGVAGGSAQSVTVCKMATAGSLSDSSERDSVAQDSSNDADSEASESEWAPHTFSSSHGHGHASTPSSTSTLTPSPTPVSASSPLSSYSTRQGGTVEQLVTAVSKVNLGFGSGDCSPSTMQCSPEEQGEAQSRDNLHHHQHHQGAFQSLSHSYTPSSKECSIQSCLHQFTSVELLMGNNKLLCESCTERRQKQLRKSSSADKKLEKIYTSARKQMLISSLSPVITLHLKRFHQAGMNLRKVNRHVDFPLVLDLAPFCSASCKNLAAGERVLYSLYGIVEHSGSMRGGHYTAYVKVRSTQRKTDQHLRNLSGAREASGSSQGQWVYVSDTTVQTVPESRVLNSQAYLLFYEEML
ncbi:ubiquitin carboxyl-terminal hydrolase 45 isoform X3 [Hippoglossus hippoglossus]|uniref:ubiquitin carboxyl-terminal hydrolase 45 isoform X3 n=1 Tax=Hippoglossus hippoglossus TaxID=8267 RepID=UPI00148CFF2A|nr:ubiquitin carboxyl-terminal hydrolase 45 isoform X3 [Hippoglossus hippoglossus]XP_035019273.1 ubiquitin carboxyl-terminal hydrolase 45 isoform X3 [Hippoglossus stenolepis]